MVLAGKILNLPASLAGTILTLGETHITLKKKTEKKKLNLAELESIHNYYESWIVRNKSETIFIDQIFNCYKRLDTS